MGYWRTSGLGIFSVIAIPIVVIAAIACLPFYVIGKFVGGGEEVR